MGPSGSGKSTIAKLIAGFWDVSGGSITLGGADLKDIPLEQLNRQIAYVSQDNYLFDRTVRENIRMGRLDASDEEMERVAKAAGCDEFIRRWIMGTTRSAAVAAGTCPAGRSSGSPLPGPF